MEMFKAEIEQNKKEKEEKLKEKENKPGIKPSTKGRRPSEYRPVYRESYQLGYFMRSVNEVSGEEVSGLQTVDSLLLRKVKS